MYTIHLLAVLTYVDHTCVLPPGMLVRPRLYPIRRDTIKYEILTTLISLSGSSGTVSCYHSILLEIK